MLSARGRKLIETPPNVLLVGFNLWDKNRYDKDSNPTGIINLVTSENKLVFDVLKNKINEEGMFEDMPEEYSQYFGGLQRFNQLVAEFLTERMKTVKPIDAANIVSMNGVTSIVAALVQVICDEGDSILIPTPFYSGFLGDLGVIPRVKACPVHLSSQCGLSRNSWELTVDALEEALVQAKKEGANVRALLLTTPNNPLGCVYSREQLVSYMNFTKRHNLHCIVDEIYMMTVFDETIEHVSALSIEHPPDPERLHVLWGFSKDFAVSGFRSGVVLTESRDVLEALNQMGLFFSQSTLALWLLSKLLSDKDWLDRVYFPTNRVRLRAHYDLMTRFLDSMSIPYVATGTGLYVWCDLSRYMREKTFEEEDRVWKALLKAGVLVAPGVGFMCAEPGWFRIIFSIPNDSLEVAFERMRSCLCELTESECGMFDQVLSVPAVEEDLASAVVSVSVAGQSEGTDESLEDLVLLLKRKIAETDWLEQQTAALNESKSDGHGQ